MSRPADPSLRARRLIAMICATSALMAVNVRPTSASSPIDTVSLLDMDTIEDLAPVVISSGSWYRMPHDETGVVDPSSSTWITALRNCTGCRNYLTLGGFADPDHNGIPRGTPYYRAKATGDDNRIELDCFADCVYPRLPKVPQVCSTAGALRCFHMVLKNAWIPGDGSDSTIVVYDRNIYADGDGGYAIHLHHYCPPLPFTSTYCTSGRPNGDRYTAAGVFVTYLGSNGLPGCWPQNYAASQAAPWIAPGGDLHNNPHHGVPAPYRAIRYNEVVLAGSKDTVTPIPHMLKITLPSSITNPDYFFPSIGSDGNSGNPVPEGIVMRIKPSITLTASMFGGNEYALAIALTLQRYGGIVGETDDNISSVGGVENLAAEGSSRSWTTLGVTAMSLSTLPLSDYEFLYRGYGGPSLQEWRDKGGECERQPIR